MRNTKVKIDTRNWLAETLVSSKNEDFDFDAWAAQVRSQLLAALKKSDKVTSRNVLD